MLNLGQTMMYLLITFGVCMDSPNEDPPLPPINPDEEIVPIPLTEPNAVATNPMESLQLVRGGT